MPEEIESDIVNYSAEIGTYCILARALHQQASLVAVSSR